MGSFCVCSRRALELFVKEACGVTLGTSRPTHVVPFSHSRKLGTRSCLRQLQPVALTRQDDSFIPFDADGKGEQSLATPSKGERSERLGQAEQLLDKDTLDDDWHAEVEIVAPWPQETSRPQTDEVNNVTADSQDGAAVNRPPSVDDGSLQELHEPPQRPEPVQRESTLSLPFDPQQTDTANSGPVRSRTENRMLRKLRRIQAGTFRSTAETRVRRELEDSTVKSVLGIMKATKGISAAEEKEESSKAPPVSEGGASRTELKEVNKPNKLLRPRLATTKTAHQASATKGERNPGFKRSELRNKAPAPTSRRTANTKETTPKTQARVSTATTTTSAKGTRSKDKPERESWQIQKNALKEKFGEQGWKPRKRLSPDTLDGIRALHVSDPNAYTTPVLAAHFQVTPEAIRRILKSKWRPSTEEVDDRRDRWERRGERKWKAMAEQGTRPPAKWRAKGIKTPQAEQKRAARRQDGRYVRWEDDKLGRAGSSLAQRIL